MWSYNYYYMITLNNFDIQSFFGTSKMTAKKTWQQWSNKNYYYFKGGFCQKWWCWCGWLCIFYSLMLAVWSFYEACSREISVNKSWDDCQAPFGYQLETLRSQGKPRFVLTGYQMEALQQRNVGRFACKSFLPQVDSLNLKSIPQHTWSRFAYTSKVDLPTCLFCKLFKHLTQKFCKLFKHVTQNIHVQLSCG